MRYAIERLLYRLSVSAYVDDFVLKGATLFAIWMGSPHRATKDLDLLGRGSPDEARLVGIFREIVSVPFPEDGMGFDGAGITSAAIRSEARYPGVRVVVPAELAGARLLVQVDVGLGDAAVPAPTPCEMASLLDLLGPRLPAYARETVVAEKLEALVVLGLATSRMKDLYDLELLRRTFSFDQRLHEAVAATFAWRCRRSWRGLGSWSRWTWAWATRRCRRRRPARWPVCSTFRVRACKPTHGRRWWPRSWRPSSSWASRRAG